MMSEDRFDQLAKAVASPRREFLKLAASVAAGGLLALIAATGASAMEAPGSRTSNGKKCPAGMVACGKTCCDTSGGDLVCHNGVCCLPPRCY